MEPEALAGMIFALIVLVLIGGFILLLPLSRRLGNLLDVWVSEKKSLLTGGGADVDAMLESLRDVSRRLEAVEEQQVFLQELVSQRAELPSGGDLQRS